MKRLGIVAGTVVAGVVLAGAGTYVGRKVLDNIEAGQSCQKIEARLASTGEMIRADFGDKAAVILGDSYTAGEGLDNRSDGWAYKLADAENWDTLVAGIGSTGYINQGPCGKHAYANRIARAVAAKPDVLVIQGGLNDWKASPSDEEVAARALLNSTKAVPTVIVVGPVNAPSRAERLPEIDAALSRAADARGAQYISALSWDDLEYLPDRLHLTPVGHTRLAAHVAEAISAG